MIDQVAEWRDRVRASAAVPSPLRIVGSGSKDFYGQRREGEPLDVSSYSGIVDYDPTELVITARCGTRLTEIEQTMAVAGQMLAFEPPHFGPGATLGGCIAAGLSGPRRPYAGAVRDFVLGVRLLDGDGDDLRFGGKVMKNVAGFDVSRLVVGALGTLGVILEASLKCSPLPQVEATQVLELTADEALRQVNEWGGIALPLSATCWHRGRLHVRLSGAESAVVAAQRRLGGESIDDAQTFWHGLREQTLPFFSSDSDRSATGEQRSLWRLSVRSTAPHRDFADDQLVEWGGALRWVWLHDGVDVAPLRDWAAGEGGHATLFRGAGRSASVFQPLSPAMMTLHQRIKTSLDPAGIFNRHRMYEAF